MIDYVGFTNFKALRDAEVPLSNLTLIVGPNCSGKTSILEGLHCLSQVGADIPDKVFAGPRDPNRLRTSGVDDPMKLWLCGTWNGVKGRFHLTASCRATGDSDTADAWLFEEKGTWDGADVRWEKPDNLFAEPRYRSGNEPILRAIRGAVLLHLDPGKLAEPGFSQDVTPRVEFDGSNLGVVLAEMALNVASDYQALIRRLRTVVPSVKSLGFPKTMIERETYEEFGKDSALYRLVKTQSEGRGVLFDFTTGAELLASQASEGTLLTLGLLTILSAPSRPRLVLIDELERGLHPKALGELVTQIRELQKQFPDLQIVATTHSPYLVDHFQPNEVVLTALKDDGSVVVGTLDQHPEFDRWKEEMKPGEFWSTVGERWLCDRGDSQRA